jgi:hypothetical protein
MKKLCATMAVLAMCGAANADSLPFTQINAPAGGEQSILQVINSAYGGGFSASGLDFVNPGTSYSFVRVQDRLADGSRGTDLHMGAAILGTTTDQVWQGGMINVQARAKWAGNSQNFGYITSTSVLASNTPVFMINGGNFSGSGATAIVPGAGGQFRLSDDSGGTLFDSMEAMNAIGTGANAGRQDHMVTYEIRLNNLRTGRYLVMFEDLTNGDFDFNDLGVELMTVVPLPPAAWAGLASLAGVGVMGRIRRVRLARK